MAPTKYKTPWDLANALGTLANTTFWDSSVVDHYVMKFIVERGLQHELINFLKQQAEQEREKNDS